MAQCEARRLWVKHGLVFPSLSDPIAHGPCLSAGVEEWSDGEDEPFDLCDEHWDEIQFLVMLSGKID